MGHRTHSVGSFRCYSFAASHRSNRSTHRWARWVLESDGMGSRNDPLQHHFRDASQSIRCKSFCGVRTLSRISNIISTFTAFELAIYRGGCPSYYWDGGLSYQHQYSASGPSFSCALVRTHATYLAHPVCADSLLLTLAGCFRGTVWIVIIK